MSNNKIDINKLTTVEVAAPYQPVHIHIGGHSVNVFLNGDGSLHIGVWEAGFGGIGPVKSLKMGVPE